MRGGTTCGSTSRSRRGSASRLVARAASRLAARAGARASAARRIELDRLASARDAAPAGHRVRRRARAPSTASPTRRARRCSRCSSSGWARTSSAKACAATWRSTRGATRPPRISSRRSAPTDEALVPAFPRLRRARRRAAARRGARLRRRAVARADAAALRARSGAVTAAGARRTWVFPACFEFGDANKGRQVCTLVREARRRSRCRRAPARNGSSPIAAASATTCRGCRPRCTLRCRRRTACSPAATTSRSWAISTCWRAAARSATEVRCRSPRGSRRTPMRARRAAPTRSPTSVPHGAGRRRQRARATPRGSAATSATARARWAGCRARARRPTCMRLRETAVPLVAVRGQDAALARKAQQLAQRWLDASQRDPAGTRGARVLVAAARTSGKDAPQALRRAAGGRARPAGCERARGRVSRARRLPRSGAARARAARSTLAGRAQGRIRRGCCARRSRTTATRTRRSRGCMRNIDALAAAMPREAAGGSGRRGRAARARRASARCSSACSRRAAPGPTRARASTASRWREIDRASRCARAAGAAQRLPREHQAVKRAA